MGASAGQMVRGRGWPGLGLAGSCSRCLFRRSSSVLPAAAFLLPGGVSCLLLLLRLCLLSGLPALARVRRRRLRRWSRPSLVPCWLPVVAWRPAAPPAWILWRFPLPWPRLPALVSPSSAPSVPPGLGALGRSSAPPSSLVPVVASGGRLSGGPAALLVPAVPCPGRSPGWSVVRWPLCGRWPSPLPVPAWLLLSPARRPVASLALLPALGRSGPRAVRVPGVRPARRRCSVCPSLSFPSAGPASRRRRCPCFPVRLGCGRPPLRPVPGPAGWRWCA